MLELTDVWSVFALTITSPRLELRLARDEDLPGIVEAVLSGIHYPAVMPFSNPGLTPPRKSSYATQPSSSGISAQGLRPIIGR
jgi:hypothetical protein